LIAQESQASTTFWRRLYEDLICPDPANTPPIRRIAGKLCANSSARSPNEGRHAVGIDQARPSSPALALSDLELRGQSRFSRKHPTWTRASSSRWPWAPSCASDR
jgi:hypothetical protein